MDDGTRTRARGSKELSVADVVSATGIPIERWIGDCFGIALAVCDVGLVEGCAVAGYYSGSVAPDCPWIPPRDRKLWSSRVRRWFGDTLGSSSKQLAWDQSHVRLADGRVLDAVRWMYEMVPPYVYVGSATEYAIAEDWRYLMVAGHLREELQNGGRRPYDGSDSFCEHLDVDLADRRALRDAMRDPWFRPFYELAAIWAREPGRGQAKSA